MSKPVKGILFDMDDTLIDWSAFPSDWATMESRHLQRIYDHLSHCQRPLNCKPERFAEQFRSSMTNAWAEARTNLRAPFMPTVLGRVLDELGFTPDETMS